MSIQRKLASVTPEDTSGAGRPLLWGYGARFVAALADRTIWTVRADIRKGKLDPASPVAVIAYALRKRGHGDLASRVTETLTRSRPAPPMETKTMDENYTTEDARHDDERLNGVTCPRHGRRRCDCCRGCGNLGACARWCPERDEPELTRSHPGADKDPS